MSTIRPVKYLYTQDFDKLASVFTQLDPPYTEDDVRSFSKLYRSLYKALTQEEKQYAERMVDLIIEGLEKRENAALLSGVN